MGADEEAEAAGALLWSGDIDGARSRLDDLIETHGDPSAFLLRGLAFFMDDRLDEAAHDWEAAFQGIPPAR